LYACGKEGNMKNAKRVGVILMVLLLSACADKFLAAKIAVSGGRVVLNMAQVGMAAADKMKDQECLKVDPAKGQKYQECRAKFEKFKARWPQIQKTAKAGFDTADASIDLAEKKEAGLPIDVMSVVKASVCLVAECLGYIPGKYRKWIQGFLDGMKGFGCK